KIAFAAVVSLVATTKPSIEAAPASAPLPSHHDQRPGHSRSARRRTTAAIALRTPAMANAGPGSPLMRMPPVLQRTAQSTRSTTASRRVAIEGLLLSPRRGRRSAVATEGLPLEDA